MSMPLLLLNKRGGPRVDFSFLGSLPGGWSHARASGATRFDPSGALETVAANVPRFMHEPVSGKPLGLLLENQVQNGIRNAALSGAVVGTPGTLPTTWYVSTPTSGVSHAIVGTGTEYGMPYVDLRLQGTPSPTNSYYQFSLDNGNGIAASVGQTWTASAYVRRVGGSLGGVGYIGMKMDEQNGGVYLASASQAGDLTDDLALFSYTRTLTAATVNNVKPWFYLRFTEGPVDLTVRLYAPQIEQAYGASSRIITSGVAATRALDSLVLTDMPWFNQNAGSFVFDFTPLTNGEATAWIFPLIFSVGNNSQNCIGFQLSPSNAPHFVIRSSNVVQVDITRAAITRGTRYRFGFAWDAGSAIACMNGDTPTEDASLTLPVGTIDRLRLGSDYSGAARSGLYERLRVWNRKLSPTDLQRSTTL